MAADKDKGQRRVYVLPNELVERIVAYQTEVGLQSEVEAARRLLDEALKRRDSAYTITRRFQERLKETKLLAEIAKDVLMGHPLLSSLSFGQNQITFALTTGEEVTVFDDGTAGMTDRHNQTVRLDKNGADMDELPF